MMLAGGIKSMVKVVWGKGFVAWQHKPSNAAKDNISAIIQEYITEQCKHISFKNDVFKIAAILVKP